MITLSVGLCYVGFVNRIGVVAGVCRERERERERDTSSIYWGQLSRFHLKMETE
jgi:hypothetical protein